jgi:hypothetical protein
MLHPQNDTPKKPNRYVVAQRFFSTPAPDMPGCVSAQEAAGDGARDQQPGVSAMRHKPQKKQVSTARQGKRDNRGIDDRNKEKSQRSQVHKPVRRQRRLRVYRWKLSRLLDNNTHTLLPLHSHLNAAVQNNGNRRVAILHSRRVR